MSDLWKIFFLLIQLVTTQSINFLLAEEKSEKNIQDTKSFFYPNYKIYSQEIVFFYDFLLEREVFQNHKAEPNKVYENFLSTRFISCAPKTKEDKIYNILSFYKRVLIPLATKDYNSQNSNEVKILLPKSTFHSELLAWTYLHLSSLNNMIDLKLKKSPGKIEADNSLISLLTPEKIQKIQSFLKNDTYQIKEDPLLANSQQKSLHPQFLDSLKYLILSWGEEICPPTPQQENSLALMKELSDPDVNNVEAWLRKMNLQLSPISEKNASSNSLNQKPVENTKTEEIVEQVLLKHQNGELDKNSQKNTQEKALENGN